MKIPFSICDDDLENPVIYTLSHSKKFYHLKLEDFITGKTTLKFFFEADSRKFNISTS